MGNEQSYSDLSPSNLDNYMNVSSYYDSVVTISDIGDYVLLTNKSPGDIMGMSFLAACLKMTGIVIRYDDNERMLKAYNLHKKIMMEDLRITSEYKEIVDYFNNHEYEDIVDFVYDSNPFELFDTRVDLYRKLNFTVRFSNKFINYISTVGTKEGALKMLEEYETFRFEY